MTTDEQSKPDTSSSAKCEEQRLGLYAHLLRRQLERILVLVDLEEQGQSVAPDGFSSEEPALREPSSTLANETCHYGFLPSYSRHEPRLEVIQNGLRQALKLGRFHRNGEAVPVDGFRLRHLRQWANYPMESLFDNVGSLSNVCNCDCDFCYLRGTAERGPAFGRTQLSRREVATRARYYSPQRHTGLLPASRFLYESFANPRLLEILEQIHTRAPREFIYLLTNGSGLTEEAVSRLARLRPILVDVSLNGATVDMRMRTMHDEKRENAEIAVKSIELLRNYEIPYSACYVPWPSKPLSDLEQTIRRLDRHDATLVRVHLPTWTRSMQEHPAFDASEYWSEIGALVQRLRHEVAMPIYLSPTLYQLRTLRPVVLGTIKHSPAARAGIQPEDMITAIEGDAVWTRPQVSRLLSVRTRDANTISTRLTIQRAGESFEVELPHHQKAEELRYPYSYLVEPAAPPGLIESFGLYLPDGFELTSFVKLKEICEQYPNKRVLFFISALSEQPFLEGMRMLGEQARFVEEVDLYVEKLVPRYWGGNVVVGDLWTVEDVIQQTEEWTRRYGFCPDLIILPGTFLSQGGRDLLGRCYREMERTLGIEVRLLPCNRIWV